MHVLNLPESTGRASVGDRPIDVQGRRLRHQLTDLLPVATGVLIVGVVSLAWLQVLHPYLEHDDWDSLLPVTPARVDLIHGRLLSEGRWLNYWWWLGPGHLFSTIGASMLYLVAYIAFVARVAQRWAPGWLGMPVVIALLAAPMPASASFWPSTLGPSMVIAAVAAWTLPLAVARNRTLVPWIVVFVVLSFFAYPPVTLVLLVVFVVELIDESWKRLIGATGLFGLSYLVATVGVFTLNKRAFGKFGIEIRPWRHPNPLHNLHDLRVNVTRYLHQVDQLVHATALPVILGLCALVACLAASDLRRRAVRLMLAYVVVAGVEASPTILYGVYTPYRGSWWAWLFPVVPLVWLARKQAYLRLRPRLVLGPRWLRTAVAFALIAIGVSGIQFWRDTIHRSQRQFAQYSSIERQLGNEIRHHPADRVLIYGSAFDWKQVLFAQHAQYLAARANYSFGITVSNCRPPACIGPTRVDVASQIQRGLQVVHAAGTIYVVPQSGVHLHPTFR